MEKNYCNKCGKCCSKIPIDFNQRVIFRDGVQQLSTEFEELLLPISKTENITFCSCKFLENNLCTNPNKPEECEKYPSSPFAFLPENCGYTGEIFMKKEQVKQKIRKLKEEILDYTIQMGNAKYNSERNQYKKMIEQHERFINKYNMYDSKDW